MTVRVVVLARLRCAVFNSLFLGILVAAIQSPVFATGSATLMWNSSADPTVVGYKIYYGAASKTYTNMVPVGSATNVTVIGLVGETTYYFAATAYNATGIESPFSSEVAYTVATNAVLLPPVMQIGTTLWGTNFLVPPQVVQYTNEIGQIELHTNYFCLYPYVFAISSTNTMTSGWVLQWCDDLAAGQWSNYPASSNVSINVLVTNRNYSGAIQTNGWPVSATGGNRFFRVLVGG